MKSVIYYTDNGLDETMLVPCQNALRQAFGGEIVSVSLKPMNFGRNIVLEDRKRSYPTMVEQILTALENATGDVVFFCEHDVAYSPSHFDFTPPKDDVYYYNLNNYRWRFPTNVAITYNGLTSLSQLCCNRQLAVNHYRLRMQKVKEMGLDALRGREPRWARRWGYEPGTKKRRRGGITDEGFETWRSELPNIDIRHAGTFSHPKTHLGEFKHPPVDSWKEVDIKDIPGWDLKALFRL